MKRIRSFKKLFEALDKIFAETKWTWDDLITGRLGVNSKKSFGSTNPTLVRRATRADEKWLRTAYSKLS